MWASFQKENGGFRGGLVVKNLSSNAGDSGWIPGWGIKIPHATRQKEEHHNYRRLCNLERACAPQLEKAYETQWWPVAAPAASLQSCPTLCDPIDSSPPGSPVPGILQTRTLEWVAISFSNAWKWKVKVKSESEVAQMCPTLRDPMDCSLPGSSVHGIFQARVLENEDLAQTKNKLKRQEKKMNWTKF